HLCLVPGKRWSPTYGRAVGGAGLVSRFRWERWLPRGVRPLEVWDVPVQGQLFYERLGSLCVERLRASGRSEAEIDEALAQALAAGLESMVRTGRCTQPELLFLGGGLVERSGLRRQFQFKAHSTTQLHWCPQPLFPGVAGARRGLGTQGGLLLDLGQ